MRQVGNKNVDINNDEYSYYKKIVKSLSKDSFDAKNYFVDLFDVVAGKITLIHPEKTIPWIILVFTQNLMINQHLRDFEFRLKKLEKLDGTK